MRNGTKTSVLAAIIHEVLKTQSFETLADVVDVLKFRCARLRVQWTNDDITAALRLVERTRPLLVAASPRVFHVTQPIDETNHSLSHTDSVTALRFIGWPE